MDSEAAVQAIASESALVRISLSNRPTVKLLDSCGTYIACPMAWIESGGSGKLGMSIYFIKETIM